MWTDYRHSKVTITFASALFLIGTALFSTSCTKEGTPLVKVGRETITEGDLEALARVNPRLKPRLATPQGKQKVLENYVEQEMLYQESVNKGFNRSKELKEKLALYEKILVAQTLLEDQLARKVMDYYDTHSEEFERVKVQHILIKTTSSEEPKPVAKKDAKKAEKKPVVIKRSEADALKLAESIRERLGKGEDFGKVAKEVSEDDRTKNNMGDLGYVTLNDKRLERWGWSELGTKAFAMKAGEISEPIKTKDGFHILKVEEEKKKQPFEEAAVGIKFRLQADIRTSLLEELKKKYKVEYLSPEMAAVTEKPETAPAMPEGGAEAPVESDAPAEMPAKTN